jgi:hypothetical protein
LRRKLLEQVRPVAGDDPPYLVIDRGDDLEASLDLPADYFQFFRAERAAMQEFNSHINPTPRVSASFLFFRSIVPPTSAREPVMRGEESLANV